MFFWIGKKVLLLEAKLTPFHFNVNDPKKHVREGASLLQDISDSQPK
jgi:hypothetical protein